MNTNSLHSGHRTRLRRRFLETGSSGFNEHELLEMILFYALPRVNTNEIAHRLIKEFRSISGVLSAKPEELSRIKGISSQSAVFLKLLADICGDYLSAPQKTESSFTSADDINEMFLSYFKAVSSEICLIISIGMNMEHTGTVTLPAEGILSGKITPRELSEIALKNKMHRIIIGLNHPDKLPVPDENDYRITRIISEVFTPLETEIYDAIVCGCGKCFSMRRNGAFSFSEKRSIP